MGLFPSLDVMVSLQMPTPQTEGVDIEVCMELTAAPPGGRECDITTTLNVTNGTAIGEVYHTLQGYGNCK